MLYEILLVIHFELVCFNVVVQTFHRIHVEIVISISKVQIDNNRSEVPVKEGLLKSGVFLFHGVLSTSLDPVSFGHVQPYHVALPQSSIKRMLMLIWTA